MKLPYGKFKGKEVSEVAMMDKGKSYLEWLRGSLDPSDAKYGEKNQALINAINDTLQVGKITEAFNGTATYTGNESVVLDRLAELHKNQMKIIDNQEKILTIIESKESGDVWSE